MLMKGSSGINQYGDKYWIITLKEKLWWMADKDLHLHADKVEVKESIILFKQVKANEETVMFAIRSDNVEYFAAANCFDGSEVCVEDHSYRKSSGGTSNKAKGGRNVKEASKSLRYDIFKRDGFKCKACGGNDRLEVDHIVPVSKGGKTEKSNLQTLCFDCNRGKGSK